MGRDGKSFLPIVCLLALATSTIHPLNGELLSQSLLRGNWILSKHGFPKVEELSILRLGEAWNPALALSDVLVAKAQPLLGEQGLWIVTMGLLLFSIALLYRSLTTVTRSPALAFLLSVFASFGISSSVSDPATALGAALCSLEIFFLVSNRLIWFLFLIPIHALVDGSYFLVAFYAPLFGVFRQRVLQNLLPALLAQALLPAFGIEVAGRQASFSIACAVVGSALALCLALSSSSKRAAYLGLTGVTILAFGALQYVTQFPALALVAPIHAAALWQSTAGSLHSRWEDALRKLEEKAAAFATPRNRMGLYWLSGAFLYFQIATSIAHPIAAEFLPESLLDSFVENRPGSIPIHSPEIGGYTGLHLSVITGTPVNYIDSGAQRMNGLRQLVRYRRIFNAKGNWKITLAGFHPRFVLCRGAEPLCAALRKDPEWKENGHTLLTDQMDRYLKQFPPERAEIYRRKLEQEAWFMLQLSDAADR